MSDDKLIASISWINKLFPPYASEAGIKHQNLGSLITCLYAEYCSNQALIDSNCDDYLKAYHMIDFVSQLRKLYNMSDENAKDLIIDVLKSTSLMDTFNSHWGTARSLTNQKSTIQIIDTHKAIFDHIRIILQYCSLSKYGNYCVIDGVKNDSREWKSSSNEEIKSVFLVVDQFYHHVNKDIHKNSNKIASHAKKACNIL